MKDFSHILATEYMMDDQKDVINIDNLRKIFIKKCMGIMKDKCGPENELIGKICHLQKGEYHFFYFESRSFEYTPGMKRYHYGVFSPLLIDTYFYESNAIDADKSYSWEHIIKHFKGYINAIQKDIETF